MPPLSVMLVYECLVKVEEAVGLDLQPCFSQTARGQRATEVPGSCLYAAQFQLALKCSRAHALIILKGHFINVVSSEGL